MRYFLLLIIVLFSSCGANTTDESKDDLRSDTSPILETGSDTLQIETTNLQKIQLLSKLIEHNSTDDSLLVERALLNIEKGNLEEAKIDLE